MPAHRLDVAVGLAEPCDLDHALGHAASRYQPTPNPRGRVDGVPQRLAAREPTGVVDEDAHDLRLPPLDVAAHVRRDDDVRHRPQRALGRQRLLARRRRDAAPAIAPRSSASTSAGSSTVRAAPHVVEPRGRPHRREHGRVEEPAGLGRQRQRVEHVVGAGRAPRGTPRRRRSRRSARARRRHGRRDPRASTCHAERPRAHAVARPIGPGPTTSSREPARRSRVRCCPTRSASCRSRWSQDPRREREHRADHPLRDRVVEDPARVRDHDPLATSSGNSSASTPSDADWIQRRRSACGHASREPCALRPPEEQRVGAAERVRERLAVRRVARARRRPSAAPRCRAADPRDRSRARPRPDGRSQRVRVPRTRRAPRGSSATSPSPSRQQRYTGGPRARPGSRRARSRDRAAGCPRSASHRTSVLEALLRAEPVAARDAAAVGRRPPR